MRSRIHLNCPPMQLPKTGRKTRGRTGQPGLQASVLVTAPYFKLNPEKQKSYIKTEAVIPNSGVVTNQDQERAAFR